MLLNEMISVVETAGLGTANVDLFAGKMPPNPEVCCALMDYDGEPPLRTQNEGAARSSAQGGERPRFQVLCRATDYATGRSLIQSIWNVLDAIVNEEIDGVFYQRVAALQSPFMLETDENDRWIFAANFQVSKVVEAIP